MHYSPTSYCEVGLKMQRCKVQGTRICPARLNFWSDDSRLCGRLLQCVEGRLCLRGCVNRRQCVDYHAQCVMVGRSELLVRLLIPIPTRISPTHTLVLQCHCFLKNHGFPSPSQQLGYQPHPLPSHIRGSSR